MYKKINATLKREGYLNRINFSDLKDLYILTFNYRIKSIWTEFTKKRGSVYRGSSNLYFLFPVSFSVNYDNIKLKNFIKCLR